MTGTPRDPALILAAHGHGDLGNDAIERIAAGLRRRRVAPVVATAYHQDTPAFDAVLDGLDTERAVVVPLFTSDGYYVRSALPQALLRNRRGPAVRMQLTPPVGRHRAIPGLVARHLEETAGDVLRSPATVLVVVGHGTRRSPTSPRATLSLGRSLARQGIARRVRVAFLDQSPDLERVVTAYPRAPIVVFPFLLGFGRHASIDVPARAGGGDPTAGGRVRVTPAFGAIPGIPELIIDFYRAGARRLAE